MSMALAILSRIARVLVLLLLVAGSTIVLMRFAPGYFSDVRELEAKYAQSAQLDLQREQARHGSLTDIAKTVFGGWSHGDLGRSRQYEAPVSELLRPRIAVTASLLARGIGFGWLLAFAAALPLSALRRQRVSTAILSAPFTLLLAVPAGAMATLCLLANTGGAVLVLSLILAARDFKFLYRLLSVAWREPYLLQARAQGLRTYRVAGRFVLPSVMPQIVSLAILSLVTALSAVVPVEVIFDVPGLGQLAWSAAMNRDLPVLLTITLIMALAVGCASMFSEGTRSVETA